uniref:Ig-like domain-containing protein n=1 Tax=Tetraodon nigroviridis TaxID=99883 RepID=H3C0S4_TETNG
MTFAKFVFFLLCVEKLAQATTTDFSQLGNRRISVKVGQNLTLTCFDNDAASTRIFWFKQPQGEKPSLLCLYYASSQSTKCSKNFENNPRFQLHSDNKGVNLTISHLEFSDSADYYYSELPINQSPSWPNLSGDSGNLNCRVHTGTCDEDHTVYWFRNSGPSRLELVYSHNSRNNQCEKRTKTCFYSLKNVNISQTGTYYCAVAACGRILFGNDTRLNCEGE